MYIKSYYVICVLPTVYDILYINTCRRFGTGVRVHLFFFDVSDFLIVVDAAGTFRMSQYRLTSSFTYHTTISFFPLNHLR